MRKHAWSGQLLCGVLLSLAASVAAAQEEPNRDEELKDLKRRLEILEKEKADRVARDNALPAATLMDPAEDKWWDKVKVGGGVRASFRSATQGSPNGHNPSTDFNLESGRLYTGGKITEWLSATLNAEFTANHSVATPTSLTPGTLVTGSPQVLDAIAEFKIANEFHIFVGRMLPATDRSNSDGPYYLATWDFPFLSDGFNAAGQLGDRDDGITLWGDVGNFKYWVGAYEGSQGNNTAGHDSLLYAARVQYDFMDAETGYYLTSTYYGDKKILALGLVANYQRSAAGTGVGVPVKPMGNLAVDFLWEQKLEALGGCTPTVEAAYYYFGRHGMDASVSAVGPFDTGAGTGFLALVGVLIPGKVGWGQFQPHVRYQGFSEASVTAAVNTTKSNVARWDFGVNYVMVGHNARVSLIYTHTTHRDLGDPQEGMLTLGTQFQF